MTTSTTKNIEANRSKQNGYRPIQRNSSKPSTIYTHKSFPSCTELTGAVVESGACSSVVGKVNFDHTMRQLGLREGSDVLPVHKFYRFGDIFDEERSLCAIQFLFKYTSTDSKKHGYDIKCDIIDGELFFLIGLPSLKPMKLS